MWSRFCPDCSSHWPLLLKSWQIRLSTNTLSVTLGRLVLNLWVCCSRRLLLTLNGIHAEWSWLSLADMMLLGELRSWWCYRCMCFGVIFLLMFSFFSFLSLLLFLLLLKCKFGLLFTLCEQLLEFVMTFSNLLNLHLLHERIQVFWFHSFLNIIRDIHGLFVGGQALPQDELFVLSGLIKSLLDVVLLSCDLQTLTWVILLLFNQFFKLLF